MGKFFNLNSAVTAIEYGLIAAGVVLAIVTAVDLLGDRVTTVFSSVNTTLLSANLANYRGPGDGIAPPSGGALSYGAGSGVHVDTAADSMRCQSASSQTSAIYSGGQLYSAQLNCSVNNQNFTATVYKNGWIVTLPDANSVKSMNLNSQCVGGAGAVGDEFAESLWVGHGTVNGNQYICRY